MSLTAAQSQAIAARGNVLVVAGAGTGKTSTLVERCLHCLLEEKPRASLEQILMVTFTEATATEMRQRIRERLKQQAQLQPDDPHWSEQLALFETAHIGTLHSFCYELVRQHFYQLELDPQLTVLAEEEARLLADETLETLLQKHYAGRGPAAEAVQRLIQAQGRGWDQPIRTLVLRLHDYTQTLPSPDNWLTAQLELFSTPAPDRWRVWLVEAVRDWRTRWLPILQAAASNEVAAQSVTALAKLGAASGQAEAVAALHSVISAAKYCPRGKKGAWVSPLEQFLAETRFLASLTATSARSDESPPSPVAATTSSEPPGVSLPTAAEGQGTPARVDPLSQDWAWVRPQMTTLLSLAQEFAGAYGSAKRELGVVDFHDLEQCALRLLWDATTSQPTDIARAWRARLRFVFVDEYQDINAAQDKIIEALSRDGAQANRFLVGDVKQSIYRFRLANPHIFQRYVQNWGEGDGTAIALNENFRSREGILEVVNSVFGLLMRTEVGGVAYDERARLKFGAPLDRQPLSTAADPTPCVELHLRLKNDAFAGEPDSPAPGESARVLADLRDLEEADKEARLVALRLSELRSQRLPVWVGGEFRPVDWRDMAVLLRSPAKKAESYAKEFGRLGVPLTVARGGFYSSLEISDLLSLLHVLDNPLQDLPLLAVLHSPLVGLDLNELAIIRLTVLRTNFWNALVRWHDAQSSQSASELRTVHAKVATFLDRFARWRRLARQASLSSCLDTVLAETHYATWLLTQTRGEQRHANVQRLLTLAQQFDQFQRQGLFRFLRFIEAQQTAEAEPEVPPVAAENAVRLMSIHQSKGLEFPVVAVADLGKAFNLLDLRAELILDEVFGLCPQIKPPHTGSRYPSLPYWLARRRQLTELLGEELRLLYVGMTRARERLLLTGSLPRAAFDNRWRQKSPVSPESLLAARSYADWLGLWFAQHAPAESEGQTKGEFFKLRWQLHDEAALLQPAPMVTEPGVAQTDNLETDSATWSRLQQRMGWRYPFAPATRQPAKTAVSVLRRAAAQAQVDDEAHSIAALNQALAASETKRKAAWPSGRSSSANIGLAHHTFLERVSLDQTGNLTALKREARRLELAGALSPDEAAVLDFKGLLAFWNSELGRRIRDQAPFVRRELEFTARFPCNDLACLVGGTPEPTLEHELVVVQGVADLVVILPQELWLLDFKTDQFAPQDLGQKVESYRPQLKLYADALSRIYRRPVSEAWLYFLTLQKAVPLKPGSVTSLAQEIKVGQLSLGF